MSRDRKSLNILHKLSRRARVQFLEALTMKTDEKEDDLVDAVYDYIVNKSYPKDCTATKKRQIRKKAERFSVEGGELYYSLTDGQVQAFMFAFKAK